MKASDSQAPPADRAIATGVVSIVIPCYRQAHFLGQAIESALSQSYPHVQVIVVNDGSPDEVRAVAAQYPVQYIEQENAGLAAARNTGLASCRGEFVVFLDADDRLLPDGVRQNVARLVEDPSLGFVVGASRYIARDGTRLPTGQPVWPHGDVYSELLRRNRIRMPAMVMFRRSVLSEIGGFDSSVDACADYDMYLRVSRRFAVAFHDGLVAEYRRHGENMSLDPARMLLEMTCVLNRQRPLVRGDAGRRAALEQGRRHVQEYYGDQLAERIRNRVRERRAWYRIAADAMRLLVLYPSGLLTHSFRKTFNWSRVSPRAVNGEADPPPEETSN